MPRNLGESHKGFGFQSSHSLTWQSRHVCLWSERPFFGRLCQVNPIFAVVENIFCVALSAWDLETVPGFHFGLP